MAPTLESAVVGSTLCWQAPVSAIFEPKEDITAYELAKCLPMFQGQYYSPQEWAAIDETWKRHFRVIP